MQDTLPEQAMHMHHHQGGPDEAAIPTLVAEGASLLETQGATMELDRPKREARKAATDPPRIPTAPPKRPTDPPRMSSGANSRSSPRADAQRAEEAHAAGAGSTSARASPSAARWR
jgi:hypothetical protein